MPLKDARRLPPEEIQRMALGIMNEYQREKYKQTNEVDLAYGVPGLGRFRVNVFQQRGTIGVVFRVIPFKIQSIEQLMLPKVLEKIAGEQRGLVLVTGTTGSGKSTTLAAMIDHINATETCHIMTIEDPIEFLIRDKRSIVNQREIGVDTMSFAQRAERALRQDPDVILVGEMRDFETIETAHHRRRDRPPGDVARCTPSTPPRPSTASSPSSRRTSRSRCGCSSARSCAASSRSGWCRAPTARGACRPSRCCSAPAASAR